MTLKKYIISGGVAILFILVAFYSMFGADGQNTLSFLSENIHTGMASAPLTQVALGGNSPNSNLAQENKKGVNSAKSGSILVRGSPVVLFDISARPLFGKNGISPQALLFIIFAIPALALFFLYVWDLLKKRRIKNRQN